MLRVRRVPHMYCFRQSFEQNEVFEKCFVEEVMWRDTCVDATGARAPDMKCSEQVAENWEEIGRNSGHCQLELLWNCCDWTHTGVQRGPQKVCHETEGRRKDSGRSYWRPKSSDSQDRLRHRLRLASVRTGMDKAEAMWFLTSTVNRSSIGH